MQAPAMQFCPWLQGELQAPQANQLFDRFTHRAQFGQNVSPDGQLGGTQAPPTHGTALAQYLSQLPQFRASVARSTHPKRAQNVRFGSQTGGTQRPFTHSSNCAQLVSQLPQFPGLLVSSTQP
jgi:hypothetical protein